MRRGGVVLSLAVHALAIAWLLRPAKKQVIREEPPATYVLFRSLPKPPGAQGPAPKARLRTTRLRRLQQPVAMPKELPEPPPLDKPPEPEPQLEALESPFPDPEGEMVAAIGGIGTGRTGEETNGGGGGPIGGGPRAFDERTMTPPRRLSGHDPEYTTQALEHEVEGVMQVLCHVSLAGEVTACRVVRSVPFMDRAVIRSLEHCKYSPALLAGGTPIEVDYIFNVTLRLDR
jgi:periplasmic protein TonB